MHDSNDPAERAWPAVVQFGLGGPAIEASSRSDLREQLKAELSAWNVDGPNVRPNRVPLGLRHAADGLAAAIQAIDSDKNDSAVIIDVRSQCLRLCRADSPVARVLSELRSESLVQGVCESILFKGKLPNLDWNRNQHVTEQAVFELAIAAALRVLCSAELGQIDAWATSSEWLSNTKQELSRLKREAKSAAEALEGSKQLYQTQLSLRAADGYWASRQGVHKKAGDRWLIATAIAGVVAIVSISALAWGLLLLPAPQGVDPVVAAVGRSLLFATLSAVFLWAVKFTSKNYSSHRHIENDAAERVVMTTSYLAFVNDSTADRQAGLDVVLRSLFRPGSDGWVATDSEPVSPSLDVAGYLARTQANLRP